MCSLRWVTAECWGQGATSGSVKILVLHLLDQISKALGQHSDSPCRGFSHMLRGFADWGQAGAWQGQDQGASAVLLSAL